MASVKLTYDDPETGSPTSTTFANILVSRGWYDVDEMELQIIQHRHLGGNLSEQSSGGMRRIITLDFGVVDTFAKRKAILYFCLDTDRQINLVIAAPGNFAVATPIAGGSLVEDEYFYRVTAVDDVGETVGSTEDSGTTGVAGGGGAGDLTLPLSWDAVSGATKYRIYRGTVTETYGGVHFLAETTSTSYNDTGAVALTSTYQLPSLQALSVAREDFQQLMSEWFDNYQEAKRFVLRLFDATMRTELIP